MQIELDARGKKLIIYYDEKETKDILREAKRYNEEIRIMFGETADYGRKTCNEIYRQIIQRQRIMV